MRYYSIDVTPMQLPANTSTNVIGGVSTGVNFTSHPNGIYNASALNVQFDFLSSTSPNGSGYGTVTIEGIGLQNLYQANNFYRRNCVIKAGMAAGLPLATAQAAQAGLIWNGTIQQSFGNWVGTEMSLDFVISPGPNYTLARPGQFVLNCKAGTSFESALNQCLNTAFPTLGSPTFAIGSQYVFGQDVLHVCSTFSQLQDFVQSLTASITPPGVRMAISAKNQISVFDGSQPPQAIAVSFHDLVGQPTWIHDLTMQFVTVLRADIQVGSLVTMPQGIGGVGSVTIASGQASSPNLLGPQYQTAFQGNFLVQSVRYIGNFRDPGAQSWITVFEAVPQSTGASGA